MRFTGKKKVIQLEENVLYYVGWGPNDYTTHQTRFDVFKESKVIYGQEMQLAGKSTASQTLNLFINRATVTDLFAILTLQVT